MQPSNATYAAFAGHDDRQSQRTTSRSCAVPWVIACLLVTISLPAFAEADRGENKNAIEFASAGGTMSDYIPVADADGFDANVSHINPRPHGALLPAIGNYERFSLRYRMKVK
jgi:hypothetical protein